MFAPLLYFSLKSGFYILIHLKPILHIWIYINITDKLTFWNKDAWNIKSKVKVKGLVAQLCPTLCCPVDHSPPGFSVHAVLQSRILEWVAIPFFRRSSWKLRWEKIWAPGQNLVNPVLRVEGKSWARYSRDQGPQPGTKGDSRACSQPAATC